MKLRSSSWTALVCAPVGVVGVLPIPLVEPDASYTEPELWYLGAVVSGIVLVIGLVSVQFPSMRFDGDRFLVRGKYGWNTRRELEAGERWVIADDRLCLQRADGSLVRLRVAKWTVARRDWRRLETTLPVLDAA